MSSENCGNCKFLKPDKNNIGQGFCRIKLPNALPWVRGGFTQMFENDWCGEWKAKKEEAIRYAHEK